jgi:hypothetical protein
VCGVPGHQAAAVAWVNTATGRGDAAFTPYPDETEGSPKK